MKLTAGTDQLPVLSATITWTQRGPWVVDVILDAEAPPTGLVVLEEGAVRLRGTVSTSGAFAGRASARVVGGRGKLATPVQTRQYLGAPLSLVLGDLGADSGESVVAPDSTVGGSLLQTWARPAESPARILDELCLALGSGYSWRTTDAGKVELVLETWPTVTPSRARVLDEDSASGVLIVDDEALELRPGTVWDGRRITAVQVQWSSGRTRSRVWTLRDTPRSLGDALARAVEGRLPSPLWTRLHPSRVVSQAAGDRSLQVFPDDGAVPPMTSVPLRTGIPGLDVEVNQGARVLLAFEEGDPRRPVALPAFDRDLTALRALHITAKTEVSVNAPTVRIADNGGDILVGDTPANPVARVGDIVQVALAFMVPDPTQGITLTSPVGPVTGTFGIMGPTGPAAIGVGQIISGKNPFKA
jgi:hypothetical protein